MPMERSQHKVAAGVGTGAWPGDTLREQEAPKPVLWKEQKVKRREPWRKTDTAACYANVTVHWAPMRCKRLRAAHGLKSYGAAQRTPDTPRWQGGLRKRRGPNSLHWPGLYNISFKYWTHAWGCHTTRQ